MLVSCTCCDPSRYPDGEVAASRRSSVLFSRIVSAAFRRVRILATSACKLRHVRPPGHPPVCLLPSVCISSALTGRISVKFYIWDFLQLGRENQILDKIGHKFRTDLSRFHCCRRNKIAIKVLLTAATCSTTMQEESVVVFPSLTVTYACQQYKEESLLPQNLQHKYSTL